MLKKELMPRDTLYTKEQQHIAPFEFNQEVVKVFDDMIHRSIPGYKDIINNQVQLIHRFYQPNTLIFDLGCSHGNLGIQLCRQFPQMKFTMIAADNSPAMLTSYANRLTDKPNRQKIHLCCIDISNLRLTKSSTSIVVINFTLQFLPVSQREKLIKMIHTALKPGGILLFSEKIFHIDRRLDELQKEFHHCFKRKNGYSDLEISQKREALENVLIPETIEAHSERLERTGFNGHDIWYKCFNFCSWICIK
ncbi:MAG: carboxy-S-adenosyl-L-methionine synthase CmoA [Desulfobacteraceae bacterium]|jgi:tRNA (cmo5U34)-methyltransferase